METFENTVTIQRPAEQVFAYLANFENVPAWNYAIEKTSKSSPGPVGVGTTYRQLRSVPRRSQEGFQVTIFEPASRPVSCMLQGVPVSCQLKQLARHDDPAEPLRQRGTPGRWHRQDRGAVILARKIPGQVLRIDLSRGSAPSLCRHRTRPRPAAPGRRPFTPGE